MRVGTTVGLDNLAKALEELEVELSSVSGVSIDIDSDDAFVLETIGFSPEFVIVEHNPTLPSDGRYRNPPSSTIGNNLGELIAVGTNLGLYPVGLTNTNLIMCNKNLYHLINEIDVLEELSNLDLPRFGWGYDGTLIRYGTNGTNTTSEFYYNGWSGHLLFQPTPKFLRGYQDSKLKRVFRTLHSGFWGVIASLLSVTPQVIRRLVERLLGKR